MKHFKSSFVFTIICLVISAIWGFYSGGSSLYAGLNADGLDFIGGGQNLFCEFARGCAHPDCGWWSVVFLGGHFLPLGKVYLSPPGLAFVCIGSQHQLFCGGDPGGIGNLLILYLIKNDLLSLVSLLMLLNVKVYCLAY